MEPQQPYSPVSQPPIPPRSASYSSTKTIVSLVLGILSLVCCGFFAGIPAIILGKSELKAIDAGQVHESNRMMAKVGMILGIVGTILYLLGLLIYALLIVLALTTGSFNF